MSPLAASLLAAAALAAAALAATGCAGPRQPSRSRPGLPVAAASPAANPTPTAAAAGLRVALVWSAPVDLDLYVTDPAQETVYFANPRAATGGRLANDTTCREAAERRLEVSSWERPPVGRYRVGVDFIEDCGRDLDQVRFRVVVDVHGRRFEREGTVQREVFEYEAFAFEVPPPVAARAGDER